MLGIVEEASIREVDKLYRIEQECFPEGALTKDHLAFLIADGDYPSLVYKRKEEIVAFIIGRIIPDTQPIKGHILTLDVSPTYHGQGIGTLLLQRMEEELRNKGVKLCSLEVREDNTPALNLYQKAGYHSHSILPNYYGDEDGVLLQKNLP
ncbi:MAG: ribosomal protein S18-alanine N-acetyltransferase [Thermoproteota archaeon]